MQIGEEINKKAKMTKAKEKLFIVSVIQRDRFSLALLLA